MTPRNSLRQALGLRLAGAGLAATVALVVVLGVVYALQRQRHFEGWLADAQAHFERQSQRVEADWRRQADLVRAQIEATGALDGDDERLAAARFTALMAAQGGQGTFTHLFVIDPHGRTVAAYGTRSGTAAEAPASDAGPWRFLESDGLLYRVLHAPLRLGPRGQGTLVVQVPLNNELLASIAFPATHVSLHWQGRDDVAMSGHSEPTEPSSPLQGRRLLEGMFSWGGVVGGPQLHASSLTRDRLSALELLTLAGAGALGAAALAWLAIGRWARRHVHGIDALASAVDRFGTRGEGAAGLRAEIAGATAAADAELQRLSQGLGAMMTAVEAMGRENAEARARLQEANATLEQRVDERTRELAVARDEALAAARTRQQILASVSHELRTPLVGLLGSLELVDPASLPASARRLVEVSQRSGLALRNVIDDVLDYSRLEAVGAQLRQLGFHPDQLAAEAVALHAALAVNKGLRLRCDCDPASATAVRGDPLRLRQVLLNLVGDAIKFTDRGSVELRVRTLPAGEPQRLVLRFEVQDTGIGIDEPTRARLFDPFVRADAAGDPRGGTGLGLAIGQRLVAAMGGRIELDSTPGVGSTFRFEIELPVADAEAAVAPTDGPPLPESRRVLLVEDNPVNRMIVSEMLRRLGMEVEEAENGLLAIESLRRRRADLVLMDHEMPVLDGLQASRRIRDGEAGADAVATPIVAVTAHALGGDAERCLAAGMNDYLPKPFTQEQLAGVLSRWLQPRDLPASAS